MSVRIDSVAPAYAVTRAPNDSSRLRPAPTPAASPNSAAITPAREAALKRQLEDRLSTDIARIRQRVDTTGVPVSPSDSVGRLLDIRA